jgi:hypothetical protein
MMNFEYSNAELTVNAVTRKKPPRMDEIQYELVVCQPEDDSLNIDLLRRILESFIFNTVKACCSVSGTIKKVVDLKEVPNYYKLSFN